MPDCAVERERIRSFLREGLPWHEPEKPHTELSTPDDWWDNLDPVFIRALVMGRRTRSIHRSSPGENGAAGLP
jgi:hypothetical protein